MKHTKTIFILILMVLCKNLKAQEIGPKQPVFYGKVKILEGAYRIDSLLIQFYRPNSIGNDAINIWIKIKNDETFNFKLPFYNKPSKILIQAFHSNKKGEKLDSYFVEADDNINIMITCGISMNSIDFSGKGSEKYNLVRKLRNIESELSSTYADLKARLKLYEPINFNSKFQKVNEILNEVIKKKEDILNESRLDSNMKKMVNYEYCNVFTKWDFWLYSLSFNKSYQVDSNYVKLRDYFNQYKEVYSHKSNDLMVFCPSYITSLSCRLKFDLIFNNSSYSTNTKDYYVSIKDRFQQPLRGQLIAKLFGTSQGLVYLNSSGINVDSLMIDADKEITLPFHKNSVFNVLKLSKGKSIYNTSFTTLDGEKIDIGSLRGKVVLIDLWGVGCGNCAVFHQMFENEIHPHIKSRNDFVLLSVSMDRSKEKWLEGINSGIYTSKNNLNVYTDGLMFNHPFAKYYNLNYSPFLLLLDREGKIYSQLKSEVTSNDILKTIQNALNQ